ncbi:MAG: hypothetical protein HY319_20115 [Armatimonadetes bacterium]|nr:hypothetical protein [Armatimonadota bacterium]
MHGLNGLEDRLHGTAPPLGTAGAADHLAAALIGCLPLASSIEWSTPVGSLRYVENSWSIVPTPSQTDFRFQVERRPRGLLEGARLRSAEHRVLHERCRHCPVPILLDNRPIERAVGPSATGRSWNPSMPAGFALVEWLEFSGAHRQHLYSGTEDSAEILRLDEGPPRIRRPSRPGVFLRLQKGRGQCHRAFCLPASLQGPGRIVLVSAGVVAETWEGDLGCPGVGAVVTTQGVNLDLSGFAVVKDDDFWTLVDQVRSRTRRVVAALREHLRYLERAPAGFREMAEQVGECICLGPVAILLLPMLPLAMWLAVIAGNFFGEIPPWGSVKAEAWTLSEKLRHEIHSRLPNPWD